MRPTYNSGEAEKTQKIGLTRESLAQLIDHTLIRADVTAAEIDHLCKEAAEYHFKAVCVNPYWVKRCAQHLDTINVRVCCTIGFPLGATSHLSKISEVEQALADGASELDVMINLGELKAGNREAVLEDLTDIVAAAQPDGRVKVILETCLLTDEEKKLGCEIAMEAGAKFIKTSTGFNMGGATVEDVKLIRGVVGTRLGVKASSRIHTLAQAKDLLEAGATRLGCSRSVAILRELNDGSDRIS
ncbi:MAG: deoxyribose-phosphate aldolase [Verrucomicrobiae bacterium]|nr:deoxyribose-phosphate aldolase [Verrucomicrobiae bacterium]